MMLVRTIFVAAVVGIALAGGFALGQAMPAVAPAVTPPAAPAAPAAPSAPAVPLAAPAAVRAELDPATAAGAAAASLRQKFVATRSEPMPEALKNVGVDEHFNVRLPLETEFVDEAGNTVRLGDYFRSGRPVIIQLGYLSCPKLCDEVSKGTADSLANLDLKLGEDYDVLFVSIDPTEKPALAAAKKKTYLASYAFAKHLEGASLERAASGWHFLTASGREEVIREVAEATGFRYKFVESAGQYAHPAVIILVSPAGAVTRYLYGVKFDQKLLRLSLVETSQGKAGSVMDQILLYCFHFEDGNYTLAARRLMQLAGALTVLCLASTLGIFTIKSHFTRGMPARTRGLGAVLRGGNALASSSPGLPGSPSSPSSPSSTGDSGGSS